MIGEPYVYRAARLITVPLARRLPAWISPDGVTLAWGLCLAGAGVLLSEATWPAGVGAAGLIAVSHVLDCLDGDIARHRDDTSKLGAQLEQVVHWLAEGVVVTGATVGVARGAMSDMPWLVGMAALIGTYTFAFVYHQLSLLADRTLDYGALHTITRWLYRFMPLSMNLLALGALLHRVELMLTGWTIIALSASFLIFGIYYRVERGARLTRKTVAHPQQEVP